MGEVIVALSALLVAFLTVVLHHGSRRDFLGTLSVAPFLLGALLDVLIHALFFLTYSSQVLSAGHFVPPFAPQPWLLALIYRTSADFLTRFVDLPDF